MKFAMRWWKLSLIFSLALLLLPSLSVAQHYTTTILVSNNGQGGLPDSDLQNPWGLVAGPGTPWWVSNNAGGTTTLYSVDPTGTTATKDAAFSIQPAPGQAAGSPSGIMFNGSPTDFFLAPGVPALFIFVTEDGTVQGWSFKLADPSSAVIKVDNSKNPDALNGAVYKGATIAEIGGKRFILAANFRSGRVDVFDTNFRQIGFRQAGLSEDAFGDEEIPHGFAPFNIQGLGPNIYITYAKQDASTNDPNTNRHDPVKPGEPGDGFVHVFDHHGRLLQRLEHGPWFNAPWGVVWATQHFGEFTNTILVGQFRPGVPAVAAFNPVTGRFLGNMLNPDGSPLTMDGLWALRFGNDHAAGPGTTLFFTAGPDNETNGIFGTLTPIKAEQDGDEQ